MTSFFRSLGLSVVCLGLVGIAGCSEDNEATMKKETAKNTGEVTGGPQPKTQAEYFQQQQVNDQSKKGGAYQTKKAATPTK